MLSANFSVALDTHQNIQDRFGLEVGREIATLFHVGAPFVDSQS
jgi:hypothetical protein